MTYEQAVMELELKFVIILNLTTILWKDDTRKELKKELLVVHLVAYRI